MPSAALSICIPDKSLNSDVYLSTREVAELLGVSRQVVIYRCKINTYIYKTEAGNGGEGNRILLSSLPPAAQQKYIELKIVDSAEQDPSVIDDNAIAAEIYARAPEYNRKKHDKYSSVLQICHGLKGRQCMHAIDRWNKQHPDMHTSYAMVRRAIKGTISLVAGYGNREGDSIVTGEQFAYFAPLYLKQGGPDLESCWYYTLGHFKRRDPSLQEENFPSPSAFRRVLDREVPIPTQYLARHGKSAYDRKFGSYCNRDYSGIRAGQIWVSDHAQIDVAVLCEDGKVRFPWVTVWRDFKTSKWLGWMVHYEDPNSDHIFMAFYYAACRYGLPEEIIIDNGKDYRCKDFAGGRITKRMVKVSVDEGRAVSMMSMVSKIGVTVHFARPYNAKTKPVERDFRTNKHWFSKNMPGYRGGNVVERPECLKDEIKAGKILKYTDLCALFDGFIENVLHKATSRGKNLLGKSRDMAWNAEFVSRRDPVNKDSLILFCMRTSKPLTIGKNGVEDSNLGLQYWGEWMPAYKGTKVYMRRDIRNHAEAWCFDTDDKLVGMARASVFDTPAMAHVEIEKARLGEVQATIKRAERVEKAYLKNMRRPDPFELMLDQAAGRGVDSGEEAEPKIREVVRTGFDDAIEGRKELEAAHREDLGDFVPEGPKKEELFFYDCDKPEIQKVG